MLPGAERHRVGGGEVIMRRTLGFITALTFVFGLASVATAQSTTPPPDRGAAFVDANGDGICDNVQAGRGAAQGQRKGKGYGPGDGTGNQGVGPRDGTGYGPGTAAGTGTCTGTCTGTQQRRGAGRRGR
jgi:hypothetical protein